MRLNRKKRAQLAIALAAALVAMVMASGSDAWAAPPTGSEVRHGSGLTLLGPFDYGGISATWHMSEKLQRAYNGARILADHNQGAFGYPWQESDADVVVIRVANAEGEALARRWMYGGIQLSVPKAGERVALDIAPPEVGVRLEAVGRTVEQLERIQHAVGPGLAAIPNSNLIWQSGPDAENNRIVYVTDRVSDAMLRALAARFGTEALAVRIERNPRFTHDSPLVRETSPPVDPVVAATVTGSAALVVGVALWLLMRRRVRI
jgi:hypothetical protein